MDKRVISHVFLACRSFPQLFAQLSPTVPNSSQPFPAFSPKSFEIALQSFPKPPPNLPKTTQNPSKRRLGAYLGLKKNPKASQEHPKSAPGAPKSTPKRPNTVPNPSQREPKTAPNIFFKLFLNHSFPEQFLHGFLMEFRVIFRSSNP